MVESEEELTTAQAAAYVGMTRQALSIAAERGEIGTKQPARGRKPDFVYTFTQTELDTWKARPAHRSGRPKKECQPADTRTGDVVHPLEQRQP
ncbi:MAG: hypothetical protein NVS2B7_28010 [Herpetosiphon sp.]